MTPTAVRTLVPARSGRAVRVARGEFVRVTDLEGGQVGDLFAFVAGDRSGEHLSAAHTRTATSRLWPAIGETFVTDRRRPILTLVEDTSPGFHDLLIAACDPQRYAGLGAPGHPSCAENLATALAPAGLSAPVIPQPVNVFMRVQADRDGRLDWLPAATTAGDSVTFRAELDCVVVLSACPQDLTVINGTHPTDLALDVLEDLR
ncbi:DUF1989 domain-containing protein [Kribbella sp. CA-253562]|uniref:DUF1989 domain-containing protein n=1 Tax=Kribbella sp. CA-253562 TaxID=3239942 RepID=UPI003D8F675B